MNVQTIHEPSQAKGYFPAVIMRGKIHAVHFSFLQNNPPVIYADASKSLASCNCFKYPLAAQRAAERVAASCKKAEAVVLKNEGPRNRNCA